MRYRHCLNVLVILVLLGGSAAVSASAQTPDGDEPTPQATEVDRSLSDTPEGEATEAPLSQPAPGTFGAPANQINAFFWFDDFNRPDGPLGGNWTVHGGTINIVSQYAQGAPGGGNDQRATFNGASSSVVQADVAMNGTGSQFSALILNHDGSTDSDYIYFKVQNQNADNLYEYGACYSDTADSFGLGFFLLDSPFQTGHVRTERIGDDLVIDITNIDSGGQPDQHYVCSGAPTLPGSLTGIRFWRDGRLDNWCAGPRCDARPGLYTVRETGDALRRVNLNDMTITDVGPLGVTFQFGGLAYDPNSDILYMVDGRGAQSLYTVDQNTGAATLVGAHGVTDLFSLAYDSTNDALYAAQYSGGTGLYSLDVASGAATLIGDMGRGIGGLAYNAHTDQLIGIQDGSGDLYEIDRATGATTLLYSGDYTNDSGLAYDPDRNLYWDIDWNGNLYSYDPDYGYIRLQHLTALGAHDGAAYVPTLHGFAPPADYVAATWSDAAVHLLDAGLVDQSSFPAGATVPNGIATDGTVIWTGHWATQEVIGHNYAGTELFRWSGTLSGLQGMELVEGDLAIYQLGNIEFYQPYDGTFIRSIPASSISVEGIAYDGELLWQITDANLYGIDPADGALTATIPNAAAGCAFEGTGIAARTPGELTLACANGDWYKVSSVDGSVIDAGSNGLNMYGLKAYRNTPPRARDDDYGTDEDTAFTTGSVLDNDSDGQGPVLFASYDDAGLLGLLSYNGDGTFDYDPDGQFEILDTGDQAFEHFTYTIADTAGLTDTATVTLTIDGVNDPPLAEDDGYGTDENTAFTTGNVLDNDSDAEGPVSYASHDDTGLLGLLSYNGDGTFDYDPDGQFESLGTGDQAFEHFTYTISDTGGLTDTATVTLTIDGVNDPPLAEDDDYSTDEDTAFTTGDVLDNDSDAEGPVSYASHDGTGLLGLLSYNGDGTFDYDPDGQFESLGAGDQAFEFFTYTISDTGGLTDTATVTLTIDGVNDPPLAADDVYTTSQDTPLVVVAPGVLDNDDDAEGDTLQALWDSGPGNGDLTLNADGSFVYTPTVGFGGVDTFRYHASDGLLDSNVVTVTLAVTETACTAISTATLTLLTGGTIYPGDPLDLRLDLMPVGFTPPYSYTLDFDDGNMISDVASLAPITLTHSYTAAGSYQVSVGVWNCAMTLPVSDSAQVTVTEPQYKIYLPMVIR